MKKLVLFGANNFAELAHYFFDHDSDYKILGFTVDGEYLKESKFQGLPVVPFEEVTEIYPASECEMFIAVGIRDLHAYRTKKVQEAQDKGYRLASYMSSRAIVPRDFKLQPNSWIMETVHLHPFVEIGKNSIIWSRSTIGFRSSIGENCWISAGLCGERVTVKENTFIGLGATISSFVTVGARNIIGAGALILRDTEDGQVYKGTESRPSSVPSSRLVGFNG